MVEIIIILHKWFFIVAVHYQVLKDQAFNDWPTALWVAFYLNSLNVAITVRLLQLWDKEGLFFQLFLMKRACSATKQYLKLIMPALLCSPSTILFYASVSKGAASTIFTLLV